MASEPKGYLVVPVWCDGGIIKAITDNNGRIPVSLGASGITLDVNLESSDITLPTQEQSPLTSLIAQLESYIGAAYVKQAPIWGYSVSANERVSDSSDGSNPYTLTFTSVPSGYVRRVQCLSGYGTSAAYTSVRIEVYIDGGWVRVYYNTDGTVNYPYSIFSPLTLAAGENARVLFYGTSNGNTLKANMVAYDMKVS